MNGESYTACTPTAQREKIRRRKDWVDISGRRFGRLLAVGSIMRDGREHWACWCDCGKQATPRKSELLNGRAQSCGCYRDDRRRESKTTHGATKSRMYGIWSAMRVRCGAISKNHPKHASYRDKGIRVCDEWATSFEAFRDWSNANGYADNLEIDRRDNSRGYEPDNCRWVTKLENLRNRTSNCLTLEQAREIKARLAAGGRGTAKALAAEFNVSQSTICDIKKGRSWPDA